MYAIPNPFCAPADACPPRTVLSLSRPPVFTRRSGPQGSGLPKLPVSAPSSRMGSFPAPFPLLLASGDPHLGPDAAALHLLAIETGYDSLPWPLTPSLPRRPASLLSFLPAHPARGPALARRPEARGCRRNARLGGGALCLCVRVAGLHPHSPDSTSQGLSPAFASRIRRTPNHRATGMFRRLRAFLRISRCLARGA